MSSIYNGNLKITIFGESHSEAIGVVIDGLKAGLAIDFTKVTQELEKRKPYGDISSSRQEKDELQILSGFWNGRTTGTPLAITILNRDIDSTKYAENKDFLRPSHADYSAFLKYHGFQDYRGGGHFSGRITAPVVVAGAICKQILETQMIKIGTHIKNIYNVTDEEIDFQNIDKIIDELNNKYFATISPQAEAAMIAKISQASKDNDSLGGILETVVVGDLAGLGEPFFNSFESTVSALIFSIPGIKGIEFGLGFDFCNKRGSEVNDAFHFSESIKTKTNYNGGINGGITNGMPIIIKTVVKPTPSISRPQETVNIKTSENVIHEFKGRFDPCIVHRARVVVDSMVAIAIVDLMMAKKANEWMDI